MSECSTLPATVPLSLQLQAYELKVPTKVRNIVSNMFLCCRIVIVSVRVVRQKIHIAPSGLAKAGQPATAHKQRYTTQTTNATRHEDYLPYFCQTSSCILYIGATSIPSCALLIGNKVLRPNMKYIVKFAEGDLFRFALSAWPRYIAVWWFRQAQPPRRAWRQSAEAGHEILCKICRRRHKSNTLTAYPNPKNCNILSQKQSNDLPK
jgi:hypothetical protein